MINFPTKYEMGEVRGDQVAASQCYITMLEIDDHLQTMCIKKQWTVAELVEGLEEILFDDSRLERTMRIGTLACPPICQALTAFLRENQDMFA